MYNKFLFIGLGGSGGKTLRFLKDQIRRWMREHGIEGDIPAGWQFLHIDLPPNADGNNINNRVRHLAGDEYLGLAKPGVELDEIQRLLDESDGLRSELRTWRVEPDAVKISLLDGAGQFRAIGQTVGLTSLKSISGQLDAKMGRLRANNASRQLATAYSTANAEDNVAIVEGAPYVFVISSLAGGTGAGLLNPVCDLIRAKYPDVGNRIVGILYTSEVFRELVDEQARGVHGNGLAAVCELLNGYWWGGDPIEDPFLQAVGAGNVKNGGPTYPFLVGLRNTRGVDFGTFDALFEGVGRALRSWVTDEEVAGAFIGFVLAGFGVAAGGAIRGKALVDRGEIGARGLPAFSALGFARVSLGTDHFERYAVDRVVRDAYEHLVSYHTDSDAAKQVGKEIGSHDANTLAERLAENYGLWFREEVGFGEDHQGMDPIMGALSPPGGAAPPPGGVDRTAERCTEYQRQIAQVASLDAGDRRTANEWRARIDEAVERCFDAYAELVRADLDEQSREWVAAVETRALAAVETAIKRYGLKVTACLCDDLAEYLRQSVAGHLRSVSVDCLVWSGGWQDEAAPHLQSAKGKMAAGHVSLRDYLDIAVYHRSFELDSDVAKRAAKLASEAAQNLFAPLSGAIEDALGRLDSERESAGIEFGPPENEFSLIEAAEYRPLFDRLLRRTFGSDDSGQLREAVIGCDACDQSSGDRFIHLASSWMPEAKWSGAPKNIGVAVCPPRDGSSRDLLIRSAAAWLGDEGGPFGELLGLGLRGALDTSAGAGSAVSVADRSEYQRRFLASLAAAVGAAAPLVDIDPGVSRLVSDADGGDPVYQFSRLPFGRGPDGDHPMESKVREMLAPILGADVVATLLQADERRRHIDITSTLASPQSVLAVRSLLDPISRDWGKRSASVTDSPETQIQAFWEHRRARPLQRFVPVPQAHLRCLVRGWFTAGVLGRWNAATDGTIEIARDGKSPAKFPHPSLPMPPTFKCQAADRLGPVLEALSLAYLSVSKRGDLEPLEPYVQLLELGMSGDGGILYYERLNVRLANWLESGDLDPYRLTNMYPPSVAGLNRDASWRERVTTLVDALDELNKGYKADYEKIEDDWDKCPKNLSRAPLWTGLWPLIGEELQRLREAVKSHTPDSGLR
ncbi:MAG: hypothetical protein OXH20_06335 [bacterium]|nr:hypothetical protein [bacterium]